LVPESELKELRLLMLPEEYDQEMECSFDASTKGAFYVKEMSQAEHENRIIPLETNPDEPLDFFLDLGYRDDTTILATQKATDGYPLLHAEADNQRPIHYYINRIQQICKELGAPQGRVYLPHDARAKSLQTGKSIVEQFMMHNVRPHIVPSLDLLDGIAAARMLFPEIWFNEPRTRDLIMALKSYRREYNEDRKVFNAQPIHDWSSHYADVFRYFAIIAQKGKPHSTTVDQALRDLGGRGANYAFSLEDLYNARH
jgi:phage terminase large subunit